MSRLGLIGFNTHSGLGVLNRQLATYLPVSNWLVKPHRLFSTLPMPEGIAQFSEPDELIAESDVILFAEQPLWHELPGIALSHGKRVVCVPMQEWMPEDLTGWPAHVDLFICPTLHCYDQFKDRLPCAHVPWPVDTERFPFHERSTCERFVFINGHGGWRGRKGGDVIQQALALWPDMPLTIFSQVEEDWPHDADVHERVGDNREMYRPTAGDVLLAPHTADGIGLEFGEALASGMPIVATEGRPWLEYPLLAAIPATKTRRRIKREVDWYVADAAGMVETCKALIGCDISVASREAHLWAQSHSWKHWAKTITELVLG